MSEPLIEVRGLTKHFPAGGDWFAQMFDRRVVHAVDDVSLSIERGTTLGLVGESGSGKSTIGKMMVGLSRPTAGEMRFGEHDLRRAGRAERKRLGRHMQMIFQDPSSSLNRRKTAAQIVAEPVRVQGLVGSRSAVEDRVSEALSRAGLSSQFLNRYPHEMSGGQRQRIGIARALAVEPDFIICDEPVTALDVSIQAQILNLLMDLKRDMGLTYLFVAHDLSVVRHVSDEVAVMYLGHIMERAPSRTLFSVPKHPYTRSLLKAVPVPDPKAPRRTALQGEVPSPITPPTGCRFHTRCPEFIGEICRRQEPPTYRLADGSLSKCHLHEGEASVASRPS
jgi:oligopeptide/dipeptide ABC transporter ATP-binding protein